MVCTYLKFILKNSSFSDILNRIRVFNLLNLSVFLSDIYRCVFVYFELEKISLNNFLTNKKKFALKRTEIMLHLF